MENTKIAVVTDSNSGITQQQAKELGVTVILRGDYPDTGRVL